MEENTLQQKIKKQFDLIKDQVNNFKKSFQTKSLQHNNFVPYLQALNYVFDLNNTYGEDYFQFISKKQLQFLFLNNRTLMKDISSKLKSLSAQIQKQKNPVKKEQTAGICKVCNLNIESRNIQQAKNTVEDMGLNNIKKMLRKMEQQSNMALFTIDQDKYFFKELNRVLLKKQEILAITDNHLENYLEDIMKNLGEIKYMDDLKDTTFQLPLFINWESKIKGQINAFLLNSFKGKVPSWITKTFDEFVKMYIKLTRKFKEPKGCQTDPYTPDEVFELRTKITQFLQQQKISKSINQDYSKQIVQMTQKIKTLEIQNTILKDKAYAKDISINRYSTNTPKQFRSQRNSSLNPQIGMFESNQKNQQIKKSNFKSTLSSSFHTNQLNNKIQQKIQQIVEQEKQNFGTEERKQYSVTEHKDSENDLKPKRRKHKKLTDVEYFKKMNSKNSTQGFLPMIKKNLKQQVLSELSKGNNRVKKTSILSDFSLKITKNDFHLQIPSQIDNRIEPSKSIIEEQQKNQHDISETEINLSQSQRQVLRRKYKQTVSEIQFQMQEKIQNIEALKKNYELKKKNSLLSIHRNGPLYSTQQNKNQSSRHQSNKNNSLYGSMRNRNSMIQKSQKKNDLQKFVQVSEGVQTENTQSTKLQKQVKSNRGIQKLLKKQKSDRNQIVTKQLQEKGKNIQVQTEKSYLTVIKRFQNNENFSLISDDHFEQIMNKLLFNSVETKSPSKFKSSTMVIKKDIESNQQSKSKRKKGQKYKTLNQNNKSQQKSQDKSYENSISNSKVSPKRHLFTKKDFGLFLNQQNTYKYQASLTKKYHKNPCSQLTQQQQKYFTSAYGMIQMTKNKSPQTYIQILSFIKYPFQTVVNDFSCLNIVKEMSLQTFLGYMARIKHYHSKCNHGRKEQSKSICSHVQNFIAKIENGLVENVRGSVEENDNKGCQQRERIDQEPSRKNKENLQKEAFLSKA